jgi:hypothetical protein
MLSSHGRCANRVDDALMEQMLRHNLYAKTPFRPRHLNLSGASTAAALTHA